MKRNTSIKYCREIHRRVKQVNGLLATPLCQYEAVRISQVWVFGSTAKGKENPNDLDILIRYKLAGRHRTWQQTKTVKPYRRICNVKMPPASEEYMLKWISKGMIKVSRHSFEVDNEIADGKIEIYPRYLFE